MKIHGKKISGPNIETVVFPRNDGDIVFRAQAVLDYDDFEKLNPIPQPPQVLRPGGILSSDVEDKKYKAKIREWSLARTDFMVLKSLEATPGLEWETVDMSDHTTWDNYREEMKDAGLSPAEMGRIVEIVSTACGLNQDKIDEATKRFLAMEAEGHVAGSSPSIEQSNTPSGEPVSVSA